MFRITEDPSSGSLVQCLVKNYKNDSIVFVDMDKVGVMAAHSNPLCVCVCVCVCVVHRIGVYCVPSYTYKYFIILIVSINYILCISWIVKCLSLMHGANMKIQSQCLMKGRWKEAIVTRYSKAHRKA